MIFKTGDTKTLEANLEDIFQKFGTDWLTS